MTKAQVQEWNRKAMAGTVSDDQNPIFIYCTTSTELLRQIAEGKIDATELAKRELENRYQTWKEA
jgi:hypothetical protein